MNMSALSFELKTLERSLQFNIKRNTSCLGVDTASRTGWAKSVTNDTYLFLDYGFVDVDSKDIYFKYNQYVDIFKSLTKDVNKVVIEETYFGLNARVFQMLSRMGGLVYAVSHLNNIEQISFMLAVTARKTLGLKSNVKKEEVQKEFVKKINLRKLKDCDIIDAIVLSFAGLRDDKALI